MAKNKKVMSLAIKPDLKEQLDNYADLKGLSTSEYVGDLVEKAIQVSVDEDPFVVGKREDFTPIVLQVPKNLRSNADSLRVWLGTEVDKMVAKLTKPCCANTNGSN